MNPNDRVMYEARVVEFNQQKAARDERRQAERERAAFAEAERALMAAPSAPGLSAAELEHGLGMCFRLFRDEELRPLMRRVDEQQIVIAELRVKLTEQQLRVCELEQRLAEPRHASVPALRVLPGVAG